MSLRFRVTGTHWSKKHRGQFSENTEFVVRSVGYHVVSITKLKWKCIASVIIFFHSPGFRESAGCRLPGRTILGQLLELVFPPPSFTVATTSALRGTTASLKQANIFCSGHTDMMWSLLPAGLLALIFSSPALGDPTSPYNALHDISKFAQRPPEPPICCLTPLPSNEPAEEILSFDDWKAKQVQMHENDNSSRDTSRTSTNVPNVNSSEHQQHQQHSPEPQVELQASAPEPAPSPHFGVPLIDRFNYADLDCSARIRGSHRSAKHASSILSSKKDRYMLRPCKTPGEQQYVVVELCEDIRIDTVQLANFEFFSGVVKEFSVSVAQTDTPDPAAWTPAGTYTAKNIRGIQVCWLPYFSRTQYDIDRLYSVFPSSDFPTRLLPVHPNRLPLALWERVLLPTISSTGIWPYAP